MKLIDVFRFTEKIKKDYDNSLLEYYRTINSIINRSSNVLSKRWRDWMVDEVDKLKDENGNLPRGYNNPESEYDYVMTYFNMVIDKKVERSFSVEEIISDNNFKVNINILNGVGDTKGDTDINKKPPVVNITIYTSALNEIIKNSILAKKYAYKSVNELLSKIIHLLSHELTHYFQVKKNTIDVDSETFVKKLSKKKNLEIIRYFYYCTQPHELEALLNSAYKLYCERNSFLGDKKDNATKRSYFRCLIYEILNKLKANNLAINFLLQKISLDDVCDNFREHTKFLIFWIIFCYAENDKKYGELLKKSEGLKTSYKYNINIMKENKETLYNFLKSLNNFGISSLNVLLDNFDRMKIFDDLFSINTSNKNVLEKIRGMLPIESFKKR